MSDENKLPAGSVAWIDLTVTDAPGVRDFYKEVVGWDSDGCKMDGYEDYNMMPGGTDQPVAGICHARETNADTPQHRCRSPRTMTSWVATYCASPSRVEGWQRSTSRSHEARRGSDGRWR